MALPLLPILLLGGAGVALVMMSQKKSASADSPAPSPAKPVTTKAAPPAAKLTQAQCQAAADKLHTAYCAWRTIQYTHTPAETGAANAYSALYKAWPASCGPAPDPRSYPVCLTGEALAKSQMTPAQKAAADAAYAAAYHAQSTAGAAASALAAFEAQKARVAAAGWGPTDQPAATAPAPAAPISDAQAQAIDAWLRAHAAPLPTTGAPAASGPTISAPSFNDYSKGNVNLFGGGGSAGGSFGFGG